MQTYTITADNTPIPETMQELNASLLQDNLTRLFPTSGIKVYVQSIIGSPNMYVRYTNGANKNEYSNGIMENDPAFMRFCFGKEKGKVVVTAPCMHSNRLRNAGVKFRKISAVDEATATQKLLAWFQKNHDLILSVGKSV